jgi:CHAT domain-containing protein
MNNRDLNKELIASKLELLQRMFELGRHSFAYLIEAERAKSAGDLKSAKEWYEKHIAVGKEHVQIAEFHNQHYKPPVDIVPIVQPIINTLFMLGDVLDALEDLPQANKLREEAVKLSEQYLTKEARAEVERGRAAALLAQGRFNEALVALANSRDIFLRENNPIQLVRVTIDMVDLLNWLGDHQRALSELEHASQIYKPLLGKRGPRKDDILTWAQDTVGLYRASVELDYYQGLINKTLRKFDEAKKCFETVLPEYQRLRVGPAIEFQLASILVMKGDYSAGLEYTKRLEPVFLRNGMLRSKLSALLKVQAEALLNMGKKEDALNRLNEGLKDFATYYDPDLEWRLLWLKGRVFAEMRQPESALESYIKAAEIVNKLRRAPLGYRLDSTYLKDKVPLFEAAIALASLNGPAEECCRLIEMIKSRILTATLSVPRETAKSKKDISELENKVDEITKRLEATEYSAYKEGMSLSETSKRTKAFLAERSKLMERIRFSDQRWRSLTEPVPFEHEKLAALLRKRGQSALNLFYGADHIAVVLIKEGTSSAAVIDVDQTMRQKLQTYVKNLQLPWVHSNPILFDPSIFLGLEASHFVPEGLLDKALQSAGLIIVPHGPLHLLPWAGLMHKKKRLFEYCPVGIVPNLTCIFSLNTDFSSSPRIALIGSPDYKKMPQFPVLPNAEEEVKEITLLYKKAQRIIGNVLTYEKVTEEAFWLLTNHPEADKGILHIVCHGSFEIDDPMHSGLMLSDSRVDASEIARSSIRFDEVILSACSSGWRPLEVQDVELSGDDILGLPGAFLEAGARSVLVSIPYADDAAAFQFMVLYHQHRSQGRTPMAAFQETQNKMLQDSKYEPFTWLGFTVYGCQ